VWKCKTKCKKIGHKMCCAECPETCENPCRGHPESCGISREEEQANVEM